MGAMSTVMTVTAMGKRILVVWDTGRILVYGIIIARSFLVVKSLITVKEAGGWASINYFVFPGMTDQPEEFEALCKLIETTGLDMIQWRNFNIDPDWYLKEIGVKDTTSAMGMKKLLQEVHNQFPHVKFGYYNPPMERIKGNFETDFAHA
ncbi:MAG: hypothetical protein K6T65_15770 [Peptococcaceae bacterium]|nr:hypothetical protein [Peptococcaceae bacterium]